VDESCALAHENALRELLGWMVAQRRRRREAGRGLTSSWTHAS
jgi:hypothetical protein